MKKKWLFYSLTLIIVLGCALGAIYLPGSIAKQQDENLLNVVWQQTSSEDTGGGIKFELSEEERLVLFSRYRRNDQVTASENTRSPQEGELSVAEAMEKGEQELDKLIHQKTLPIVKPDWEVADVSPLSFFIITDMINPAYHMTVWNIQYSILDEENGWETNLWVELDAVSGKIYHIEYLGGVDQLYTWMDQSQMYPDQVLNQMLEGFHDYWEVEGENSQNWAKEIIYPVAYGYQQIGEQEITYYCYYMLDSGSIIIGFCDEYPYTEKDGASDWVK